MEQDKRHAACDECRKRKLKCTGELDGCSRCRSLQIHCVYSAKKQMGRPRKRRLDETGFEAIEEPAHYPNVEFSTLIVNEDTTQGSRCSHEPLITPPSLEEVQPSPPIQLDSQAEVAASTSQNNSFGVLAENLSPHPSILTESDPNNSCACLARMYLAVTDLQSSPKKFPFHLKPIRAAINTVNDMIHCQVCMNGGGKGNQSLLFVTSLLHSIADSINLLLCSIDKDAREADANNTKKQLCLGEDSAENFYLHTHGPRCPARFTVNLEPEEWRKITKRTVVEELRNAPGGRVTLEGLLDKLEARQQFWHAICAADPSLAGHRTQPQIPGDFTCLRLLNDVRLSIVNLPVS